MLSSEDRVTAGQFHEELQRQAVVVSSCSSSSSSRGDVDYLLIDVRPELETSICRIPGSLNFPYRELDRRSEELKDLIRARLPSSSETAELPGGLFCFFARAFLLVPPRLRRDIRSLLKSLNAIPRFHGEGNVSFGCESDWVRLLRMETFAEEGGNGSIGGVV